MSFPFKLVSPDRTLKDEAVDLVSLPTAEGEITVLEHHAPLVALLVSGIIKYKQGEKLEEIAVSDGYIQITQENGVTVLADTAERAEELELTTIEEAKARALEVMKQTARKDDVSFAAAAAALERELARYRVATRHRRRQMPKEKM